MSLHPRERRPVRAAVPKSAAESARRRNNTAAPMYGDGYATGTLDRWIAARDRVNGWRDRGPVASR